MRVSGQRSIIATGATIAECLTALLATPGICRMDVRTRPPAKKTRSTSFIYGGNPDLEIPAIFEALESSPGRVSEGYRHTYLAAPIPHEHTAQVCVDVQPAPGRADAAADSTTPQRHGRRASDAPAAEVSTRRDRAMRGGHGVPTAAARTPSTIRAAPAGSGSVTYTLLAHSSQPMVWSAAHAVMQDAENIE